MNAQTVFSVLTPSGRGAVAVVAVDGPSALTSVDGFFHANNRKPLAAQAIGRIVYGRWQADGEDLIVCRREANEVEIHCHGGSQAVATITNDLAAAGCTEIAWQEWIAGREGCQVRVEARIALAQATSTRAALVLLDQYHGALRHDVSEVAALMPTDTNAAKRRIERLLGTAEVGLHLVRPWRVVIAGLPNVGKSSLINSLVGYRRAIVFDSPGTTRDVITVETVIDGWGVSLSDTAGLHRGNDQLEVAGIELAKERLANADLMIWVLDASETTGRPCQEMERQIDALNLGIPAKQLLVLNKIDSAGDSFDSDDALATSATVGTGIVELLAAISRALVPEAPSAGTAVVFTERQQAVLTAGLQACEKGDIPAALDELNKLVAGPVCGE